MELECPRKEMLRDVGKGLKVEASGNLGMSESGSIFSFFFLTLGQR